MAFPDRRTVNILLTILLFGVALAIAYAARAVILIFAFAILFCILDRSGRPIPATPFSFLQKPKRATYIRSVSRLPCWLFTVLPFGQRRLAMGRRATAGPAKGGNRE